MRPRGPTVAWLLLVLLSVLSVLLFGMVAADEESCLGCSDYQSNDGGFGEGDVVDTVESAGSPTVVDRDDVAGATAQGNAQAKAKALDYLPFDVVERLLAEGPSVRKVARLCAGEPEELCSLLFFIEQFFNMTLRVSAAEEDSAAATQAPGRHRVSAAPEVAFHGALQDVIDALKGDKHITAHAAIRKLRNDTGAFFDSSSAPFRLLASATHAITSYLGGDSATAETLLHSAAETAQARYGLLPGEPLSADGSDVQHKAGPIAQSLRHLLAALLFTSSKLKVERGAWSEASVLVGEAARWNSASPFLHEWKGLREQGCIVRLCSIVSDLVSEMIVACREQADYTSNSMKRWTLSKVGKKP